MGIAPKGHADYLALGDWNAVCSVCGRKYKASEMVKLPAGVGGAWGGNTYVCQRDWRPRQTQDFVRGIPDKMAPEWTQQPVDLDALPVENVDEDTDELEVVVDIDPEGDDPVLIINILPGVSVGTLTLTNTPGTGTACREVVINVPDGAIVDEIEDPDGVDPTINVFSGGVAHTGELVFTVQPTDVGVDTAIAPAIVVTMRDFEGNTVTSFTGNVTLSLANNPGGAQLGGTLTVAAVAGVATFSAVELDTVGEGYTLLATVTDALIANVESTSFDVTAYVLEAGFNITDVPPVYLETTGYSLSTATGSLTPDTYLAAPIIILAHRYIEVSGTPTFDGIVLAVTGVLAQDAFTTLTIVGVGSFASADAAYSTPFGTSTQWLWNFPAGFSVGTYSVTIS